MEGDEEIQPVPMEVQLISSPPTDATADRTNNHTCDRSAADTTAATGESAPNADCTSIHDQSPPGSIQLMTAYAYARMNDKSSIAHPPEDAAGNGGHVKVEDSLRPVSSPAAAQATKAERRQGRPPLHSNAHASVAAFECACGAVFPQAPRYPIPAQDRWHGIQRDDVYLHRFDDHEPHFDHALEASRSYYSHWRAHRPSHHHRQHSHAPRAAGMLGGARIHEDYPPVGTHIYEDGHHHSDHQHHHHFSPCGRRNACFPRDDDDVKRMLRSFEKIIDRENYARIASTLLSSVRAVREALHAQLKEVDRRPLTTDTIELAPTNVAADMQADGTLSLRGAGHENGRERRHYEAVQSFASTRRKIVDKFVQFLRVLRNIEHPKEQRGLPQHAVLALKMWLFDHFIHPYPSADDKKFLQQATHLSIKQIDNWFINMRVRLCRPLLDAVRAAAPPPSPSPSLSPSREEDHESHESLPHASSPLQVSPTHESESAMQRDNLLMLDIDETSWIDNCEILPK